jgi:hypothetical protein
VDNYFGHYSTRKVELMKNTSPIQNQVGFGHGHFRAHRSQSSEPRFCKFLTNNTLSSQFFSLTCHFVVQGSAANSFIDLINVDELNPQNTMPHGLHRSKDPGVGAFSTFHDRQSVARVPIQRGEELFVDYGQQW